MFHLLGLGAYHIHVNRVFPTVSIVHHDNALELVYGFAVLGTAVGRHTVKRVGVYLALVVLSVIGNRSFLNFLLTVDLFIE